MRLQSFRLAVSGFLMIFFAAATLPGHAQTTAAVERSARVLAAVDSGNTVRLSGQVPDYAKSGLLPSTAMSPDARFQHLILVMSRSADVEASFEQLLADQTNSSSPRYHQWLTPQQVGTLYGPAQSDVDAVTGWLQSRGLTVNSVSPNRLFVDFSGPVSSVEAAFNTSFQVFSLANGETRYSLVQEPTLPAAIQPVVASIAGLSQSIHYSTARLGPLVTPKKGSDGHVADLNSSAGNHYLVSGDFAVAYDIAPVYNAGYTGTGQNIMIVGLSRVAGVDVTALESIEGLASKVPNVIIPPSGVDPGAAATSTTSSDNGDQDEATLDVDRSLSTAPGATVDQVISGNIGSGNSYSTDGLYIALNYAVGTVNDPILSLSYGGCEYLNGQANDTYEANIFQTAASQGISSFVSSGDSGAAACNAFSTTIPSSQVLSINDFCANAYVTCVGGTEFNDSTNASTYWSTTNGTNYTSLLSYIPEAAWNDVSVTNGVYSEGGSGGGTSVYLPRPPWQTGTGVPSGSYRLIPDVALTASPHDGFVLCLAYQGATCGSFYSAGGTSAAAPSMAGIQALVNQKLGARQGNINPTIYTLGNAGTVFHDVTVATSGVASCAATTPSLCNNSTPSSSSLTGGLAGYTVNAGYDEVTGWGSPDVYKYLTAVSGATFTVAPATTSFYLLNTAGATATDTITLASFNGFANSVGLTCNVTTASGTAAGTCSLSPTSATLTSGGTATSTLTITNTTANTSGVLNVTVTASGAGVTSTTSAITVTVSAPTFTISTPSTLQLYSSSGASVVPGGPGGITLVSKLGFAGTVNLTCSVTATGTAAGTCAVSPTSTALAANGSATATLTVNSTAVNGVGSLSVTVSGISGSTAVSATPVTLAVLAPTFTITPASLGISTTSGTAVSDVLTLSSVNMGFSGTVNLGCTITANSGSPYYPATCAVSPASVALAANATGTATVTVSSTTAVTASLDRSAAPLVWRMGGGATLACLILCLPLGKRRRSMMGAVLLVLLGAGVGALSGCSSSGGATIPVTHSSAGMYTLTITATPASGSTNTTPVTSTVAVTIN